ncbi:hypothetical protein HYALB_00001080 [Hymenoscyphus albidus]|uniref:Zn(2)-C6 fungal-type domain-containing protein n=1 Tax=Hymenoscyphus albidus TaxID=595503 RepID=A0A9N9QC58_9HELO|nr:hypothetical protein HYALB_00001080 [Hymenoscyphus albidus]
MEGVENEPSTLATKDSSKSVEKESVNLRQGTSLIPKACESCRIRKIRCNKVTTCSNCVIASLSCKPATRNTESKPQRSAPASYYEKHFSRINENLLDIKNTLRDLSKAATPNVSIPSHVPSVKASTFVAEECVFEGDSSFCSYSVQATRSAEAEISASVAQPGHQTTEISESLSSLKSLLGGEGKYTKTDDLSFPSFPTGVTSADVELPPMSLVLKCLKRSSSKAVYFPTKPLPSGHVTLMCGMLMYLLEEYLAADDPEFPPADCQQYIKLCQTKFCAGLQTYECMTTPTLENIRESNCSSFSAIRPDGRDRSFLSSYIGAIAMRAQEESRPSPCWTLVAVGARLCLILGYHRKEVLARDPHAEVKRHAFWVLYMMDKAQTLNLGRVSSFPDHDIDADMFTLTENLITRPWDLVWCQIIEISRVMGRIYDELYSVRAQNALPDSKSQMIEVLHTALSSSLIEIKKIDTTKSVYKEDLEIIIRAFDLVYYSSLTLLYGAKNTLSVTTQINSRQFEAAKSSLQCHIKNSSLFPFPSSEAMRSKFYVDWFGCSLPSRVVLYLPFTPFLVIFTHSIASRSQEDIELMTQTLLSLEPARAISEAGARLHQVCSVFLQVAKAFNKSQQASFGSFDAQDNSFTFPPVDNGVPGYNFVGELGFPFSDNGFGIRNTDMQNMSLFLDTFVSDRQTGDGIWDVGYSEASGSG